MNKFRTAKGIREAREPGWYVSIVERDTREEAKFSGPYLTKALAELVERDVLRDLDRVRYFTAISEVATDLRESLRKWSIECRRHGTSFTRNASIADRIDELLKEGEGKR